MGGGAGDEDTSGEERDAWEAISIVLRIATVGMSLASAIMTFTSSQCVYGDDGSPASTASYSDYGSFNYSAVASLVSAVLGAVVIWLEVLGKDEWAKTVEFIDKVVLALTSTSAPLLFAADNITSCGPPRSQRSSPARKRLDDKLKQAADISLGSLVLIVSIEVIKKVRRHKYVKSASHDDDCPSSCSSPDCTVPPPPPPPPPPRRHDNKKLRQASYAGLGSLGSAVAIQVVRKLGRRERNKSASSGVDSPSSSGPGDSSSVPPAPTPAPPPT
ncbi:unnamed protein product [Urochloa humidicola]